MEVCIFEVWLSILNRGMAWKCNLINPNQHWEVQSSQAANILMSDLLLAMPTHAIVQSIRLIVNVCMFYEYLKNVRCALFNATCILNTIIQLSSFITKITTCI